MGTPEPPGRRAAGSLLDELTRQLDTTRRLLTVSPDDVAEQALAALPGDAAFEARIAAGLAAPPLARPAEFPAAHRLAIRALELLDREGPGGLALPRGFGPARPLAALVAGFVAGYIVRGYTRSVASRLAGLYALREAQCPAGSAERRLLAAARAEMQRLLPAFSGGGVGAPILVGAGAVLPLLASAGQYLGAVDRIPGPVIAALFAGLFVLFLLLSSLLLAGARHAHRRALLIAGSPLAALWQAIGNAGEPPGDDARLFATVAIVLSGAVWLLLPVGGVLAYLLG
ncbi:hypothetical protein [Tepidiforma sp.]|uniref:hypothetical protein n=1 Tax=Tepidiforma sp. TaxID=2682230 RepID=UPI002ADDD140|nr:hypothetical protein [Tepidiforma sp.]